MPISWFVLGKVIDPAMLSRCVMISWRELAPSISRLLKIPRNPKDAAGQDGSRCSVVGAPESTPNLRTVTQLASSTRVPNKIGQSWKSATLTVPCPFCSSSADTNFRFFAVFRNCHCANCTGFVNPRSSLEAPRLLYQGTRTNPYFSETFEPILRAAVH